MSLLELRDVSVDYDGAAVLSYVSLSVEEGELLLVTGPTGSGKSTLLGLVSGLVPRFSGGRLRGDVLLDDRSVLAAPPRERTSSQTGLTSSTARSTSRAARGSTPSSAARVSPGASRPRRSIRVVTGLAPLSEVTRIVYEARPAPADPSACWTPRGRRSGSQHEKAQGCPLG